MGDVVELTRDDCPCGWPTPKNVALEVSNPWLRLIGDADLLYDCPKCGRPHMVRCFGSRAQERKGST